MVTTPGLAIDASADSLDRVAGPDWNASTGDIPELMLSDAVSYIKIQYLNKTKNGGVDKAERE